MSANWRVSVDPHRCIGAGICAGTAPQHFQLVEGLSTPLAETVPPADPVIDAAESCPVEAITVHDSSDQRLIAPEP
ncbi:ferredoxin [Plantactinospora sp. S1510]|uniref:Ferredoxin n=1 Tax=Plantactinospora alkalitolerans TaxID=2789879 RepID=A0ABS0H0X2_9ACTN|nr:ferredoxin [Plantactinospora alkalitolerans]MBF9131814.1 ferredoxin [Plantactinospora alkalitolerans]